MAEPNAKFITRAYLGSQKVAVSDHWLVLQASSPGTCQLTVDKSAERFTPVAFEMGWGEMIERVVSGRFLPMVGACFPFEKLPDAHALVDGGHKRGVAVVEFGHQDP